MRLELSTDSCVLIDLRATGVLRAMGHDPTLVAHPDPLVLVLTKESAEGVLDAPVLITFRADGIEPPSSLSPADRARMRENLLGRDVLDASRFPTIELRGRYRGTLEAGRVSGALRVRGNDHAIELPVTLTRTGDALRAGGVWEGRLTDLGVKPFSLLFGALRLEDWIRLRVDARFTLSGVTG
jgi:hypothetical protein